MSRCRWSDPARKRYTPCQKTVEVNLISHDMVYRQVLVPQTGTRLNGPINVAREAQMSTFILLYRVVARKAGGIAFSGVCPS